MNGRSSDGVTIPRVLTLRCRACSTALPGASSDVAFRCPQCGRGWEIEAGELVERPSIYVAPSAGGTAQPRMAKRARAIHPYPLLYMPYWSFPVVASADPKRRLAKGVLSARDRAAQFKRAFISAYGIYRPTYVGEWGVVYTRIQPDWETREGPGPESPGASLPSRQAARIVEHYILAEIDRAADLSALDVNVAVGEPELWAIPCYDVGAMLRCPWTGAEVPAAAINDLAEIRSSIEARGA